MTPAPEFRTLAGAADYVADALSEAAQNPRGLTALRCSELAHLLDKALVINAPIAPAPVAEADGVVDLRMHRLWRVRT